MSMPSLARALLCPVHALVVCLPDLPLLPRPKNFHLQWHLTERCNLSCSHCYQDGRNCSELPSDKLFDIAGQYVDAVRRWRLRPSQANVSLTGGEPLLHKDFFPLLEHCVSSNALTCNVFTNGTLFSEADIKRLAGIGLNGLVQVSLEGMEEMNDSIRGKGTFRRITAFLRSAVSEGLNTRIAVTLSKRNLAEVPALLSLASELGVGFIMFERLVPHGSGGSMRADMLSPSEFRDVSEYLQRRHLEFDNSASKPEILQHCHELLSPNCSCAYTSLTVLPDGSVVPCRKLPVKVGDLRESSLLGIWYGSDVLWSIRDRSGISHCSSCERFSSCAGGARCVAYTYFKDLSAPDPQCWFSFDSLPSGFSPEARPGSPVLLEKYLDLPAVQSGPEEFLFFSGGRLFLRSKGMDIALSQGSILDLDVSALPSRMSPSSTPLLLSFSSSSRSQGQNAGGRLAGFLSMLEAEGFSFRVARPLPKCAIGMRNGLLERYHAPRSCTECLFLFCIRDGSIVLCGGARLPDAPGMRNRESLSAIRSLFVKQRSSCSCLYSVRGQCKGACMEKFL